MGGSNGQSGGESGGKCQIVVYSLGSPNGSEGAALEMLRHDDATLDARSRR